MKFNREKFLVLSLFLFIFVIVGFFSSFSFVSAATQKPLNENNVAYPNLLDDPDCVRSVNDPNCTWLYPLTGPKVSPASINLTWEIEGIINPFCSVTCKRGYKDCQGFQSKEGNLFSTTTSFSTADYNLPAKAPESGIGTLASYPGDTYQVTCCERQENASGIPSCKTGGISKLSHKTTVVEGEMCEIPFGNILNNLNNLRYAMITEKGFKDWSGYDDLDYVGFNMDINKPHRDPVVGGSGDLSDIYKAMVQGQCLAMSQIQDFTSSALGAIKSAKVITDARQPSPLNIAYEQILNGVTSIKYHQLIALNIMEVIEGKRYTIKVLNSESVGSDSGPSVYAMDCQVIGNHYFVNGYYTGVFCDASGSPYGGEIAIGATSFSSVELLRSKFNSICPYNDSKKICQERKANMSAWLENNYPSNVNNFSEISIGICQGWTDFILKVTYLGDFVGTDFHPNDGLVVGRGCDTNHYPAGYAFNNQSKFSQLANLFQAVINFLKF